MIDFGYLFFFSQPTQDSDDVLSDEQIARALQMDEDMEVGPSLAFSAVLAFGVAS